MADRVRGYMLLLLETHSDNDQMMPKSCGMDFAEYVVFTDGRARVRSAGVKASMEPG